MVSTKYNRVSSLSLLKGLIEQQGLKYDKFRRLYAGLYNLRGLFFEEEIGISDIRIEISGRNNNYPAHQGNLVLVARVKGLDLSKPEKVFSDLARELQIKFNNPVSLGDGGCAANAFGDNGSIGNISESGTLLLVLKQYVLNKK